MIKKSYWVKKSQDEINKRVFEALDNNVSFYNQDILGVPASHLDSKVFSADRDFVKDKPFLSALINNPNHIGCHTLNTSESFFNGTQEIEREVIKICVHDILKGSLNEEFDGYIASGGTEANLQAIWVYRNYFKNEFNAQLDEIAILCSSDTHYSSDKATNVLCIKNYKIPTNPITRSISQENISTTIDLAQKDGIKYFIVIANMMTTMFGSVDNPDCYSEILKQKKLPFKLHIDGAYGGFFYPFSNPSNKLDFSNADVSSVTLDAHKMAQAPYGTGIILFRKNLIEHTKTKEAKYVAGEDFTLVGSRSGANAIAIWMILAKHGPYSWYEKISTLMQRTAWLCDELNGMNIKFFRGEKSNIVTISADYIPKNVAEKFVLVPDNHESPSWYKIVVMEHVTIEKLEKFLNVLVKRN